MSFLDKVRQFFDSIVHHDDHASVRVLKGDSLWAIAKEITGATTNAEIQKHVDEIVALNPGIKPDEIHPGDELNIPLDWVK